MRSITCAIVVIAWGTGFLMTISVVMMAAAGISLYRCNLDRIREGACLIGNGEYAQDTFLLAFLSFGIFGSAFLITGSAAFWAWRRTRLPA
jgi:hypothetical protein